MNLSAPGAESAGKLPRSRTIDASEGHCTLELIVMPELDWFDGHFVGDPILPAVVQVDWAIHFGSRLGFNKQDFRGFSRLKFKRVIQPPASVTLRLTGAESELRFSFDSAEGMHSGGTVLFDAARA